MTGSPQDFSISLAEAAERYDFDGIARLVSQGASPDSRLGDATLLTWAVRQGQEGLVRGLLDARANPDQGDGAGVTPLIHAARLRLESIVDILLEGGADPFLRGKAGRDPYDAALEGRDALSLEFDDPNVGTGDLETQAGRCGRIMLSLAEAGKRRAVANEIVACHAGAPDAVTVRPPLRLIRPGGMR